MATAPYQVTADPDPTPWPDGTQHLEYQITGQPFDLLKSFNTATHTQISQVQIANFTGNLRPHPTNKALVLGVHIPGRTGEEGWLLVIDMGQNKVLYAEPVQYRFYKFDWLPDGLYVRIQIETSIVEAAGVGGSWQTLGRVAIPPNRRLNNFYVSPDGQKLAMTFRSYDDFDAMKPGLGSDVWISNLDGSNLSRFTSTDRTYQAIWSPDGSHLAFDHDTSSCIDVTCKGECSGWYAPTSQNNINGLIPGLPHGQAKELLYRSNATTPIQMSCNLTAWVRKP